MDAFFFFPVFLTEIVTSVHSFGSAASVGVTVTWIVFDARPSITVVAGSMVIIHFEDGAVCCASISYDCVFFVRVCECDFEDRFLCCV
jgi:hypothetical protein